MESKYHLWTRRDLSLVGKILIAKTMGISNLIYSLSITDCDTTILTSIQRKTNNFIWNYKPHNIKHGVLSLPKSEHGLKSPDISKFQISLRLAWLARLLQKRKWQTIFDYYMRKVGGIHFLLQCNFSVNTLPYILTFYRTMLNWFKKEFCVKSA